MMKLFSTGFLLIIISCTEIVKVGQPENNTDVNSSILNKTFVAKYNPINSKIRINDALTVNITECWVEKSWTYKNHKKDIKIDEGSRSLIMKTDNLFDFKNHLRWYGLKLDTTKIGGISGENIIFNDFIGAPDTITINVVKYKRQFSFKNHFILHTFKMSKVK